MLLPDEVILRDHPSLRAIRMFVEALQGIEHVRFEDGILRCEGLGVDFRILVAQTESGPAVVVRSPFLHHIPLTPPLVRELVEINAELLFGRVAFDVATGNDFARTLYVEDLFLLEDLNFEEVVNAVTHLGVITEEMTAGIQQKYGGVRG